MRKKGKEGGGGLAAIPLLIEQMCLKKGAVRHVVSS